MKSEISRNFDGAQTFAERVWGFLSYFVLFFLVVHPFLLVSWGESALSSRLLISPDGFDWVMEGRALAQGVAEPWPVLRNPGMVVLSAIDHFAGGFGYFFALANSLGLAAQWFVLDTVAKYANFSGRAKFLTAASYFLLPIHFISNYVLADTFAVGAVMLSLYLFWFASIRNSPSLAMLAGTVSVVAGSFQLYGLAPALAYLTFTLYLWATREHQTIKKIKPILFASGVAAIAAVLLMRQLWESSIPHGSTPAMLDLLAINLNMTTFYLEVWLFTFSPILLAVITFSSLGRWPLIIKNLARPAKSGAALFGLGFLGLGLFSFFYQWPESRFTYTYAGLLTVSVMFLLTRSSKLATELSPDSDKVDTSARTMFSAALLVGLVLTPANLWAPSHAAISIFTPWFETSSVGNTRFDEFEALVEESCRGNQLSLDSKKAAAAVTALEFSPYEGNIALFGLENCLKR